MELPKKRSRIRKRPQPLSQTIQLILEEQSAQRIIHIRKELQADLARFPYLNWREAYPHIGTTAFGNMNLDRVERLLRDRFAQRSNFTVAFDGISEFRRERGDGKSNFIIHLTVGKTDELRAMFDDIRTVVCSIGGSIADPESFFDWAPHLTVLHRARPDALPAIRTTISRKMAFPFDVKIGGIGMFDVRGNIKPFLLFKGR